MEAKSSADIPRRVTDLIEAKQAGIDITCSIAFEILPVDFHHRDKPFQALIFLCRYAGTIAGAPYEFRKCYARGCPHNLCTHVSQAVKIANRYLERDYHRLSSVGIQIEPKLFTLADMIVKFEHMKEQNQPALTIPDLVDLAKAGKEVSIEVGLEFVEAVEHFARHKNAQTFLNGEFDAAVGQEVYRCQRCFACYPTEKELEEKALAVRVANARLGLIYKEFENVGIRHEPRYFA
jgi:hypothetical protein